MKVLDRLGRFSGTSIVTAALLLVVLQSLVNYAAGPDFSFVLFYLLPVTCVAWLVGRREGYVVARGLLPPDLVRPTHDRLLDVLGIDPADPATWAGKSYVADPTALALTAACRTDAVEAVKLPLPA